MQLLLTYRCAEVLVGNQFHPLQTRELFGTRSHEHDVR